ncbi:uncharacterized protein V1516DRAFT_677608 [Lipomyces oligophaga]|uniref:uncharacterized protein n=1 Tax=Lipomyces oligophaga TaxID=45792 RepID=UPI0034CF0061
MSLFSSLLLIAVVGFVVWKVFGADISPGESSKGFEDSTLSKKKKSKKHNKKKSAKQSDHGASAFPNGVDFQHSSSSEFIEPQPTENLESAREANPEVIQEKPQLSKLDPTISDSIPVTIAAKPPTLRIISSKPIAVAKARVKPDQPEALTKKQRQNKKKAELEKEYKREQALEQNRRLQQYRNEQRQDSLAARKPQGTVRTPDQSDWHVQAQFRN